MLEQFINPQQLEVLADLRSNSEEKQFFVEMLQELSARITKMPVSYETNGNNNPQAVLHYFTGGCDWYIVEKDVSIDQNQAYGYANLGHGFEAGYISLIELLENNVELDLYFSPAPINTLIN